MWKFIWMKVTSWPTFHFIFLIIFYVLLALWLVQGGFSNSPSFDTFYGVSNSIDKYVRTMPLFEILHLSLNHQLNAYKYNHQNFIFLFLFYFINNNNNSVLTNLCKCLCQISLNVSKLSKSFYLWVVIVEEEEDIIRIIAEVYCLEKYPNCGNDFYHFHLLSVFGHKFLKSVIRTGWFIFNIGVSKFVIWNEEILEFCQVPF